MTEIKQKSSKNSILLAGARLVATASSILITMVLSKTMDLSANGTYSQCLTIISTVLSVISLGLMDGGNYFFNRSEDKADKQKYIDAILFIVYAGGLAAAALLIIFGGAIGSYFSNPSLKGIMWLIALRPMLSNLINVLNVLYIATDRAKTVVLRNAGIAVVHLAIVVVTAMTTKSIKTVLLLYLIAEIITDGAMLFFFGRGEYSIRIRLPKKDTAAKILRYCLPMAAYIAMNSLLRDTDKLIIGRFEPTEMQAIYNYCGKILPIDVISAAFFTILVPKITLALASDRLAQAGQLFSNYLKIGVLSTVTFALALTMCPDQAISFLYSKEYLHGKTIFILYNVVEMVKFANTAIIISAVGRTKTLMAISAVALVSNIAVSLALYKVIGFIGPAVGTVIITVCMVIALLVISAKILKKRLWQLFDIKFMSLYALKAIIGVTVFQLLKKLLVNTNVHPYIILIAVSGGFCAFILLTNWRQLTQSLTLIDKNSGECHL